MRALQSGLLAKVGAASRHLVVWELLTLHEELAVYLRPQSALHLLLQLHLHQVGLAAQASILQHGVGAEPGVHLLGLRKAGVELRLLESSVHLLI